MFQAYKMTSTEPSATFRQTRHIKYVDLGLPSFVHTAFSRGVVEFKLPQLHAEQAQICETTVPQTHNHHCMGSPPHRTDHAPAFGGDLFLAHAGLHPKGFLHLHARARRRFGASIGITDSLLKTTGVLQHLAIYRDPRHVLMRWVQGVGLITHLVDEVDPLLGLRALVQC